MTLAALRVRSFRFQWPADLLTSWAFEMETLVPGWYLMVNTGSVLLLTAFGSLQFLGTLAAPGCRRARRPTRRALHAVRDAGDLRRPGHGAQVLALTGSLTPSAVPVVAALAGIVRPNDLVMRNTLIGETIPPASMIGALGMSRATRPPSPSGWHARSSSAPGGAPACGGGGRGRCRTHHWPSACERRAGGQVASGGRVSRWSASYW